MRVCIVVPFYNEAAIAEQSIATIFDYTKKLFSPTTVFVVDDGSKDATPQILKRWSDVVRDPERFTVATHSMNRGYGAAVRTGMTFAIEHSYDYALFMDSDLTNHPKYLAAFYEKMREGCAYIKATRYRAGGGMEGVPFSRRMFSHVGNVVVRLLLRLPLTDPTNGFRAVHRSILQRLDLRENDFSLIMEELAQAKQLTRSFCEVPYILTSRKTGEGATHFSYSWRLMKKYLLYAVRSYGK